MCLVRYTREDSCQPSPEFPGPRDTSGCVTSPTKMLGANLGSSPKAMCAEPFILTPTCQVLYKDGFPCLVGQKLGKCLLWTFDFFNEVHLFSAFRSFCFVIGYMGIFSSSINCLFTFDLTHLFLPSFPVFHRSIKTYFIKTKAGSLFPGYILLYF